MTYVEKKMNYGVSLGFDPIENCCSLPNIVLDNGFQVCSNCGLAYSRIYENLPKKMYFENGNIKARQSERVYLPFGPRTIIKGSRDGAGNFIRPENLAKFERLAKINRGLISGLERNLWVALPKFNLIERKLELPSYVSEEAYRLYLMTAKNKMALGRSIDGLIAAALMCAIKIHGIPRTWSDLISASQLPKKEILKCYKAIHLEILPHLKFRLKNASIERYIEKFGRQLKLSNKCIEACLNLIIDFKKRGKNLSGKNPKGYAAGAIYICSEKYGEAKLQKEVCKITQVSEVTLRNRVRDLI